VFTSSFVIESSSSVFENLCVTRDVLALPCHHRSPDRRADVGLAPSDPRLLAARKSSSSSLRAGMMMRHPTKNTVKPRCKKQNNNLNHASGTRFYCPHHHNRQQNKKASTRYTFARSRIQNRRLLSSPKSTRAKHKPSDWWL
jgi:hypothetical protein